MDFLAELELDQRAAGEVDAEGALSASMPNDGDGDHEQGDRRSRTAILRLPRKSKVLVARDQVEEGEF